MMYKSFPFLSEKEKVELSEQFALSEDDMEHPKVIFNDLLDESISDFKINSFNGDIVYHLRTEGGEMFSRLSSGSEFEITEESALKQAQLLSGLDVSGEAKVLDEVDQWIPRPKFMKHLPVYKVELEDDNHTWVHLSSLTGEALNITTRSDRFWAWVGAIPHWIYFRDIRIYSSFWSNLILWLSALGLIMTLTGIVTGIVRYKKKPKAKFRRFKNRWYNIHYYTGLFFGLFVCTWIFSGFMSMTPFNWTSDTSLSAEELNLWQGGSFTLNDFDDNFYGDLNSSNGQVLKEIRFSKFDGRVLARKNDGKRVIVNCMIDSTYSVELDSVVQKIELFDVSKEIESTEVIHEYDNYYYDRKKNKVLPVLKCVEDGTAYYVDLITAKVVLKSDATNRTERWLYHGLHSLDFSFLTDNRPLWDIIMIFLLLGGTFVCITACGLGVKFIRRKAKKYKKKMVNR